MKRLIVVIGLLLVICLLAPVSCARAPSTSVAPSEGGLVVPAPSGAPAPEIRVGAPPGVVETPPVVSMPAKESDRGEALVTAADISEPWAARMIVRTGNVQMVVDDVPVAIDQITEMVDAFEGYVVSSGVWHVGEMLAGAIAIRVPAENFGDAMGALRELAVEVTSESTSSKDVTEEYVDLSAKLHNLEATEEQLLKLMAKAETVEDMLAIQRELSNVRGEIEQTEGRMQYLERTSATSLIEINLEQATLDVEFSADKRAVKIGQTVHFDPSIGGGISPYSYEWDFGDGNTSTDMAPTHSYKSEGAYTITLKVTDDRGKSDTRIRDGYITVLSGWNAGNIASAAWNGLVTFGHVLANIIIWLGIFSPVWIVIGGIVYWVHRRRKKKAAS